MQGVEYVVDDNGEKRRVLIDLAVLGKFWEDFQDVLVSELRSAEPRVPWQRLKADTEREASSGQ